MRLFPGQTDLEGVNVAFIYAKALYLFTGATVINACYGGNVAIIFQPLL